jgi:hypothetical protein
MLAASPDWRNERRYIMHDGTDPPVRGPAKTRQIDLRLAVLRAVSPPGTIWEREELADFCGCSVKAIENDERRALAKFRRELERRGVLQELQRCFPAL